jgi:hypothetical protein
MLKIFKVLFATFITITSASLDYEFTNKYNQPISLEFNPLVRRHLQASKSEPDPFSISINGSLICESLEPVLTFCPFDNNVRIDTYTDKTTVETTFGYQCMTFADINYDCIVTLMQEDNTVRGISRASRSSANFISDDLNLIEFIINTNCNPGSPSEDCVIISYSLPFFQCGVNSSLTPQPDLNFTDPPIMNDEDLAFSEMNEFVLWDDCYPDILTAPVSNLFM